MPCRVVLPLLLDPSHSFAVQILLLHLLVESVEQLFLAESMNQLFEHGNFLLIYERDREVLINYGLLNKLFGSCCCLHKFTSAAHDHSVLFSMLVA